MTDQRWPRDRPVRLRTGFGLELWRTVWMPLEVLYAQVCAELDQMGRGEDSEQVGQWLEQYASAIRADIEQEELCTRACVADAAVRFLDADQESSQGQGFTTQIASPAMEAFAEMIETVDRLYSSLESATEMGFVSRHDVRVAGAALRQTVRRARGVLNILKQRLRKLDGDPMLGIHGEPFRELANRYD